MATHFAFEEEVVFKKIEEILGHNEHQIELAFSALSSNEKHTKALNKLLRREEAFAHYIKELVTREGAKESDEGCATSQCHAKLVPSTAAAALALRLENVKKKKKLTTMAEPDEESQHEDWILVPKPCPKKRELNWTKCAVQLGIPVSLVNIPLGSITAGKLAFGAKSGSVLVVGVLGYGFYTNIRAWYAGEITTKECVKSLFCITAGTGLGILAGATCAVPLGVPGAIVGGIVGSVVSTKMLEWGCDILRDDDDREKALQEAYKFLGVNSSVDDQEVRTAYLKLVQKHHPDKGGNTPAFVKANIAYELIRAQRLTSPTEALHNFFA